jgi:hypothetical protein
MAMTMRSDFSPEVEAMYHQAVIIWGKPKRFFLEHGQKSQKILDKNKGEKLIFIRMKPLDKKITPLTEGVAINPNDYKKFETSEVEAVVERYGDIASTSHEVEMTKFSAVLAQRIGILGEQQVDSMEELVKQKVGVGLMRLRADGDNDLQKDNIATNGTLNTLLDPTLTQADDFWNGAFVTFTNEKDSNYGVTVQVADFASGLLTFAENLKYPVSDISKYHIVSSADVVDTDTITAKILKRAIRDLKKNKAKPMADGSWVLVIDPDLECDFMNTPEWKDISTYRQDNKNIYNGEIGKWLNVKIVTANEIYRETVAGIYKEDGDVHIATLLGRDAYGIVPLETAQKKLYTMNSKELGQTIPVYSTIGWEAWFTTKILNACYGINIVCGASK